MPIINHQIKAVLFPTPFAGIDEIKKALFRLETPDADDKTLTNIETANGYRTYALDVSKVEIPENFAKFTAVNDPAVHILSTWRTLAKRSGFRQRGEINRIKAEKLDLSPDFDTFVRDIRRYKRASPRIFRQLNQLKMFLGRNLAFYDKVFDLTSLDEVSDWFVMRSGLLDLDPLKTPNKAWREFFSAETLKLLQKETARDYRLLGGIFGFDTSPIHQLRIPPATEPRKPIKTIKLHTAKPTDELSIVSLMYEPPDVVRKFVDYYTKLGCGRIFLYFDDPSDPMLGAFGDHPNVFTIACDDDFWKGKRKTAVEGRQSHCFTHAYRNLDKGWLIVCDADEFVTSDKPLPELLAEVPANQRAVRATAAEAVWSTEQETLGAYTAQYLRMPIFDGLWPFVKHKLYDENIHLFRKNLLSHRSGKGIVRAGYKIRKIGIHHAEFVDGYSPMRVRPHHLVTQLVHFDAISYELWRRKLERRMEKDHGFWGLDQARLSQVDYYKKLSEADFRAKFEQTYCVTPKQIDLLSRMGSIKKLDIF